MQTALIHRRLLRAVVIMCCAAVPAMAQSTSHHFSVDLSAGLGCGSGGDERTDRSGVTTELFGPAGFTGGVRLY